jgi:hypothetical protein
MLHLGFFAMLAWGLKKAIILLTSVFLPVAAWVLTLTGGVHGFLVVAAKETTSNTTTSSSSTLGGEGSVIGDWIGGKEGWMQLVLVVKVGIAGLVTVKNGIIKLVVGDWMMRRQTREGVKE